jgi:hypothetical protein
VLSVEQLAYGHTPLPSLLVQAAPIPGELSCLQQLKELELEYAQLDAVPPAVQVQYHYLVLLAVMAAWVLAALSSLPVQCICM